MIDQVWEKIIKNVVLEIQFKSTNVLGACLILRHEICQILLLLFYIALYSITYNKINA